MKPKLSGYTLVREAVHGDEQSTWKAVDEETGNDVLLAVAHAELSTSLEEFDRYLFALMSASVHPHLVTVHGGGITDDGRPFMVLENVVPAPYADARGATLDTQTLLPLMIRLVSAVQHLHHVSVVHGAIHRTSLFTQAGRGTVLGGYPIVPARHQTDGGETASRDERVDVYGLAAMMWEFSDPSHLSVRLQTLLTAAVARPAKAQAPTVADLLTELQQAEQDQGLQATSVASPGGSFTELAGPREASSHLDAVTQLRVIDADTVTRVRSRGGEQSTNWQADPLDAETRLRQPDTPPVHVERAMPLPVDPVSKSRGVHAFDPAAHEPAEALYKPRAVPAPVAPTGATVESPASDSPPSLRDRALRPRRMMLTAVVTGSVVIALAVAGIIALL